MTKTLTKHVPTWALSLAELLAGLVLCGFGAPNRAWVAPLMITAAALSGLGRWVLRTEVGTRPLRDSLTLVADSVCFSIVPFCLAVKLVLGHAGSPGKELALLGGLFLVASLTQTLKEPQPGNQHRGVPNLLTAVAFVLRMQYGGPTEPLFVAVLTVAMLTTVPRPQWSQSGLWSDTRTRFAIVLLSLGVSLAAPHVMVATITLVSVLTITASGATSFLTILARFGLDLYASTVTVSTSVNFPTLTPGVYAFFVRDIPSLLVAARRLRCPRSAILVVVGSKPGGHLLRRLLGSLGFGVGQIQARHPLSWRIVAENSQSYPYVLVSADGPAGPYGAIKRGPDFLARCMRAPIYLLDFQLDRAYIIAGVRGGMRVPVPFSGLVALRQAHPRSDRNANRLHAAA